MSNRIKFLWAVGIVAFSIVVSALVGLVSISGGSSAPMPVRPPEIAGQPAPDTFIAIDFNKRYDLHCSFHGEQEPYTFRNCKVRGFTGKNERWGGYGLSSGSREYFGNWLVLEYPDGRLAYVPTNQIRFIEEAARKGD
jgi:hypothetical protein